MTVIKHNFSQLSEYGNPIFGMIMEVNTRTNSFLVYCLVILFFSIASYVITNRTNDISKGLIQSLHITTMLILLLYYGGLVAGVSLVPTVLMLGLLTIESISIAAIYFARSES